MKFLKILCALALAACAPPPAPPIVPVVQLTPATVDSLTYLAMGEHGAGTAWSVAPHTLVTAGHVCVDALPSGTVWLKDAHGEGFPAHVLLFEVSAGPEADACLLDTPVSHPALPMAPEPKSETPDFMVGYPLGVHTISQGRYLGHFVSSDTTDHGNSGSAIATAAGVYMICIQLPEGVTGCAGTPAAEIERLLTEAGRG